MGAARGRGGERADAHGGQHEPAGLRDGRVADGAGGSQARDAARVADVQFGMGRDGLTLRS